MTALGCYSLSRRNPSLDEAKATGPEAAEAAEAAEYHCFAGRARAHILYLLAATGGSDGGGGGQEGGSDVGQTQRPSRKSQSKGTGREQLLRRA